MIQKKAGPPRIDRPVRRGRPCTSGSPASAGRAPDNGTPRPSKRHTPGGVRGLSGHGFAGRGFVPRPHQGHPREKALRKTHCARRRLCGRGGDVHRLTDSVDKNKGERKRGLRPHNAYGTRFCHCRRTKSVRGFKTGTGVRAEVPKGKKAYRRARSPFVPAALSRVSNADGINDKYCKLLHCADGYGYSRRSALPPPAEAGV
jgi:hypothetical protein